MEKIRILRIINRFNIGGPTYNATLLTRYLDSDKYETLLVGGLPEEGESDSLYIPKNYGLEPTLIPEMKREPNFRSDRAAYRRLKEVIEDFKPHIVHTHAAKAGALGRRAANSSKVPVILHTFHGHVFHSYFGKAKTMVFKQIERRLASYSNRIIAISDMQKHELVNIHKICKSDKMSVIPLGFDLDPFHKAASLSRDQSRANFDLDKEVAIALIGRFAPVKNHAMFFDALEIALSKLNSRIKVFIVGDGSERPMIEERANKINQEYPESIVLTSWIKDIASFNAGMDIICLTSLNEGTPVSLIEAQASGVPVISTDVGGVRDVLREGETGYIVPSNDARSFAEKLIELIENEKKRESMSQNGWNHVRDKFSYQRLISDTERLYEQLLKEKGIR